jgi:hypothetical protein
MSSESIVLIIALLIYVTMGFWYMHVATKYSTLFNKKFLTLEESMWMHNEGDLLKKRGLELGLMFTPFVIYMIISDSIKENKKKPKKMLFILMLNVIYIFLFLALIKILYFIF